VLSGLQYLLAVLSGGIVGLSLGLVGGGGSVLAVPLMVYVVGVPSAHVAIGTSALAVAVNALSGLIHHARAASVKWRCGAIYAGVGVVGALAGSTLGKAYDGEKLLCWFALVMVLVGILMLRRHSGGESRGADCDWRHLPRVVGVALVTGLFSGFFGIGGGFLIVPGLIASTRMSMINAVGTSLLAVAAFGMTTALNYATSGLIDWPLAFAFIAGGVLGSHLGARLARRLSATGYLRKLFSLVIFAVAAYILYRSGL